MLRPVHVLVLAAPALLAGCPGSLDPSHDYQNAVRACPPDFDVEQDLFATTCGELGCHQGGAGAAGGLDLEGEGVAERLLAHTMNHEACLGEPLLSTDVDTSLLLNKLGEEPRCGDRMPAGGGTLNGQTIQCLRDYLVRIQGGDSSIAERDGGSPSQPSEPAPVTIQAESAPTVLQGYVIDATNTTLVRLPDATPSGTATYRFTGAPGDYTLTAHVRTEVDGQPTFRVRVGTTEVGSGTYPISATDLAPREFGPYEVRLQANSTIVFEGTANGNAWARLDRLELAPR